MDLLVEIAKQMPGIAAIVFLVLHALKYLERITEAHAKQMDAQSARHEAQLDAINARHEAQLIEINARHETVMAGTLTRNRELYDEVLKALGNR